MGLLCDLVNMAASLQDEDLFFDKVEGSPSNSTPESSSSEDLPEDASRFSAFDLFSFTKRIDANFREGFAWVTKINKQLNKIRRGYNLNTESITENCFEAFTRFVSFLVSKIVCFLWTHIKTKPHTTIFTHHAKISRVLENTPYFRE